MSAVLTEATIPFTIDFLQSAFDTEGFKIITWGLEPVNGYYYISESVVNSYGFLS